MTEIQKELQALDDCLRMKSDMHLSIALATQGKEHISQTRVQIGLSVAARLCRTALYGALRSNDKLTGEAVFDRAADALASEDAPVFADRMIQDCGKKGANYTLPVYRIVPLARQILGQVIPIVDIQKQNGDVETQGRVIMPWRIVKGLVQVSRATVDQTPPPSATTEEYADRIRADIEKLGVERAMRWIQNTFKDDGFVIHPVALASAAILSNERDLFGEARSVIEVTEQPG